jgi:hypothetical protein
MIDREKFLQLLSEEFPEVPQAFDESEKGLLHCEMGAFARVTEQTIDQGQLVKVEEYFAFIDRVRANAHPELENAIDVSYIEYLAFGEVTESRLKAIRKMPTPIRQILLEIDGRGRWA